MIVWNESELEPSDRCEGLWDTALLLLQCELPKGHDGPHEYHLKWERS